MRIRNCKVICCSSKAAKILGGGVVAPVIGVTNRAAGNGDIDRTIVSTIAVDVGLRNQAGNQCSRLGKLAR